MENQIIQILSRISNEAMWNTLEEYELVAFQYQNQEIYCSFLGKNVPYYGIEFFIGQTGKKAMLERLEGQYYPEYIYRFRQNSIIIMIDGKNETDKLLKPFIKIYEKGKVPKEMGKKDYLIIFEYLTIVYDMIKTMQSKNILGHFPGNHYLKYIYDRSKFKFDLVWKIHEQIKYESPFQFKIETSNQNEMCVEIDIFPIEVATEKYEVANMLVIVEKQSHKVLHHELVFEEKVLEKLARVLEWKINQVGFYRQIFVRNKEMLNFLSQLKEKTLIQIDPKLDAIDAFVLKYLQEE